MRQSPITAKNFTQSLGFALAGLRYAFQSEPNFRRHTLITLAVLAAGVYFRLETWEWVAITGCIAFMIVTELINTAIERWVDKFSHGEYDIAAGQVKDLSAGACLIAALGCAIVGGLVFLPHILLLMQ